MKRFSFIAAVFFAFTLTGCIESPPNVQDTINESKAAVFLVVAGRGMGTGFLADDNFIITNAHVVSDFKTVQVRTEYSPQDYNAKVIFKDTNADVAILEIVDWELYKQQNKTKILNLADSSKIKSVDEIYAIGNPWELYFSVSKGIISHVLQRHETVPTFLIQVDAKIYQGNSGGPLLNTKGEVIGLNTLMLARTGGSYGFAIHSNIVNKIIKDWKTFGMVRWAYMGLAFGDGMILMSVDQNSAGMLGGLKIGDRIVSIKVDGYEYFVEKPTEFSFVLATSQYNQSFEVTVERDGNIEVLDIKPKYKLSSEYVN